MKNLALMVIVLIAIASIFSFSAVSADKPPDIPAYDEPVCDVCGKLNTLIAAIPTETLTAINNTVNSLKTMVEGLQADVTELQTNVTAIDGKIDAMQEDITQIKTDVASCKTPDYIVYSLSNIAPDITKAELRLWAPGIDENIIVEVRIWNKTEDENLHITYTNIGGLCPVHGFVHMTPSNQEQVCYLNRPGEYLIQIVVPGEVRDKVIFSVYDGTTTYITGDFKVDPIY